MAANSDDIQGQGEAAEEMTGQEIAQNMSGAARARAQEEFSHLAPGPSDPIRFGDGGAETQLEEDPISEVNPFQESQP